MLKRAGLVLVGLACLLAITPAAAPVQLAYVYSDSMEPTIGQYDGYVLHPAGDVATGDVVTFWSAERDAHVTHRVVGETANGFTTKGDGNPTTDQATGHPPVRREAIVGEVLTVLGKPVVVPGLGHGVRFIHEHRGLVAGLLGLALAASLLRRPSARPSRSVPRARGVLRLLFAIALVSTVGLQFVGGTTERLTYVAVASGAGGGNTLTVGEPSTDSVVVNQSSLPLTTAAVSADGATITNTSRNGSAIIASLRVPPPTRTGVVTTEVHVNHYVSVLPAGLIRRLHAVHPLLAAIATTVVTMAPVALAGLFAVDGRQPVRTVESRWRRTFERLWREL